MGEYINTLEDLCTILKITPGFFKYILYVKKKKYKPISIPKKDGTARLIEIPCDEIKIVQRRLLKFLEDNYEFLDCQHGFIKKRSCVTNAAPHVNKKYVLNCDIENFFYNIHFGRVRGAFMSKPFNFNKMVATYISQLVCYNGHLPQGAPTSPFISNIICYSMDKEFSFIAKKNHCKYTRYADDITFSTNLSLFPSKIAYLNSEKKIVFSERILKNLNNGFDKGFKFNEKKTKLSRSCFRQEVTGIVVNEKLNVSQKYIKRIRAILNNIKKSGFIDTYQKTFGKTINNEEVCKKALFNYMYGKISYLKMVRSNSDNVFLKYGDIFNNIFEKKVFDVTETQKIYKESVKKCYVIRNIYGNGTGFSLNEENLITSTHVILDRSTFPGFIYNNNEESYCKQFPILSSELEYSEVLHPDLDRSKKLIDYTITQDDYEKDVISLPYKSIKKRIFKKASKKAQVGDVVYMVGYANFTDFKKSKLKVIPTEVIGEDEFFGRRLINTYHSPIHGMSGGPVLNSKGEVVGIIYAGNDNPDSNDNVGFISLI